MNAYRVDADSLYAVAMNSLPPCCVKPQSDGEMNTTMYTGVKQASVISLEDDPQDTTQDSMAGAGKGAKWADYTQVFTNPAVKMAYYRRLRDKCIVNSVVKAAAVDCGEDDTLPVIPDFNKMQQLTLLQKVAMQQLLTSISPQQYPVQQPQSAVTDMQNAHQVMNQFLPPQPVAGQGVAPTGLDAPRDTRATAMPGTPGHAATNVIDRMGGLDPRGQTVDGNNAAGVPKGFKMAQDKEMTGTCAVCGAGGLDDGATICADCEPAAVKAARLGKTVNKNQKQAAGPPNIAPHFDRLTQDGYDLDALYSKLRSGEAQQSLFDSRLEDYTRRHGALLKALPETKKFKWLSPNQKPHPDSNTLGFDDYYDKLKDYVSGQRENASRHRASYDLSAKWQAKARNQENLQRLDDRLNARNTALATTGGGALAGGLLANFLHKRYRSDEDAGWERPLVTLAGGVGGGALGYGLSHLLNKQAAEMGEHGLVGTGIADTAGHAMNALSIVPWMAAGTSAFKNPRKDKQTHEDTLRQLESARPDALSDTELRLGSPNLWQDMIWKAERNGEELPWYQQIGGRVLQNRRTGPLGKLIGWPTSPLRWAMASIGRGPHYDPYSDTAHNPWNNKSVTEHELGHAIDINSLTNEGKIPESLLGRLGSGTLRDLYTAAYSVPFVNLYHENEANRESDEALKDAIKNKEEFLARVRDRAKVLPAAYGSYVGGNLGKLTGPAGAAVGPLVGTMVGRSLGRDKNYIKDLLARRGDAWDRTHGKDQKKKQEEKKQEKAAAAPSAGVAGPPNTAPDFYRLEADGYGLDSANIMRRAGLESPDLFNYKLKEYKQRHGALLNAFPETQRFKWLSPGQKPHPDSNTRKFSDYYSKLMDYVIAQRDSAAQHEEAYYHSMANQAVRAAKRRAATDGASTAATTKKKPLMDALRTAGAAGLGGAGGYGLGQLLESAIDDDGDPTNDPWYRQHLSTLGGLGGAAAGALATHGGQSALKTLLRQITGK